MRFSAATTTMMMVVMCMSIASVANAQPSDVDTCANAAEESQALRKEGKLTQAREKLLICARSSCPPFIQKDCTAWLAEVDKNMPSIVLRALDAKGKDVTAVKVSVDGKVLTEKLDGRPLTVDPGEHAMMYETAGAPTVKETLLIRQGEANRLVSVTFPASSGAEKPIETKSSGIPLTTWVLGGAGIVLGGVGAALWISGKGDHSDMESGCATSRSCRQDDVDEAKTKLLLGDVAIGAGIVALGVAVVLAVMSKSTPAPASTANTSLIRY